MFAAECRKLAKAYPDVAYDEVLVDTFAMKLVVKRRQFDVIVTTNTFGDILSDAAAGLVGGLGLAPGLSAGPERAIAPATHGSAPGHRRQGDRKPLCHDHLGPDAAPWLGHKHAQPKAVGAAVVIERAVERVIREKRAVTPDLGGKASTGEMGEAIAAAVAAV